MALNRFPGRVNNYGVGLECSVELASRDDNADLLARVACLELIPESYFFGRCADFIRSLGKSQLPVLGHCVEISIGTDEELDKEHLNLSLALMDQVNCVMFSDHLCMTRANDIEIGQLTTLPFTQKVVDTVCRKTDYIQSRLTVPFMLENITNRFLYPNNEMSETDFINAVTRKAGCGLLLDVTNLYINSVNHGFDPYAWLDAIDKSSLMGIHLAGGIKEEGTLYDTHSRAVPKPVWALLGYVLERASPSIIIVEWDQDMPSNERLLREVSTAEKLLAKHRVSRQKGAALACGGEASV